MSFGSSSSSSTPKDVTPAAFQNMQQPFANVLAGLLGYQQAPQPQQGMGQPQQQKPSAFVDPTQFNGTNENIRDQQVEAEQKKQQQQGSAFFNPAQQQQPTTWQQDPSKQGQFLGMPTYQGPLTAGMTENEGSILQQLMGLTDGSQNTDLNAFLSNLISGVGMGSFNDASGKAQQGLDGVGGTVQQALDSLGVQSGQARTFEPGSNPFMDAAIQAAIRPVQEGLTQQLTRELPGRFTQAGQFVQPQGSSAFDRAAALASTGAANAMTDAAGKISFASTEAERDRMLQSDLDFFNRQLGVTDRTLGAADRQLAGVEQQRGIGQDQLSAIDRQLAAGQQQQVVQQQQVDNALKNLQAQSLPRMIEEYGIERGLAQFNQQVQNLMQLLQIAGGVTAPVVGNESKSKSFSIGIPLGVPG